jgi:N-sulfoglucosamine sulfohydrolase
MKNLLLSTICIGLAISSAALAELTVNTQQAKPNILLITVDDMNYDSVGAFGCKVIGTTPNLDQFASEGIRFNHAHVQVANCMPSRNVLMSGKYSHNNGVEGFYHIEPNYKRLPEILKENGYFVGLKGKTHHTLTGKESKKIWDLKEDKNKEMGKGNPEDFLNFLDSALTAAKQAQKPFYLNFNINDPHTPFYALDKKGFPTEDKIVPSKVYRPDEIHVPGFLPDTPVVRQEVAHYYSSVRRADDMFGALIQRIKAESVYDNTIIIFLADHGAPFPFAKTNIYRHSTRTPWMMRFPSVISPNRIEDEHMISAIDLLPTVLELCHIEARDLQVDGRSFAPLLRGEKQDNRKYVFTEHNENSGGIRNPMRAVNSKRYGYIWNPWSNGVRTLKTATTGTRTFKEMEHLALNNQAMADRLKLFKYRTVEEFYDYEQDPDALHNLIDSPEHQAVINAFKKRLEEHLRETKDPLLDIFLKMENTECTDNYVNTLQKEADERRANNPKKAKKKKTNKKKLL